MIVVLAEYVVEMALLVLDTYRILSTPMHI